MTRKWAIGALLLAVVATSTALAFTSAWPWNGGGIDADLRTAVADRGDLQRTITATGTLRPARFVEVGAQVSGQLERLHVREGDRVEAGQLIAEIDPTLAEARLAELDAGIEDLRARIRAKRADIDLARTLRERAEHLHSLDAGSREDMEVARSTHTVRLAELDALEANLRQTEASLRTARANLDYTRIVAPIDGVVTLIEAREGQTLNASQQAPVVLRIANLDRMVVRAQVSEADVLRLEPGLAARFSPLGRRDLEWDGTLETILPEPEIVNEVVFYQALFEVDNPEGTLRSQMTVQVSFVLEALDDVVHVPLAALGERRRDEAVVRIVGDDGRVESRRVRTGIDDDVRIAVLEGLEAGDRVVVGGAVARVGGRP